MDLTAGQSWTYPAPEGFEASRLVVGAIVRFADREAIVCAAVTDAAKRLPDGRLGTATIPFLPMAESAFKASVLACDGEAEAPDGFETSLAGWQEDERGLSIFTVPFEGLLERMVARQMAEIVGEPI